MNEEERNLLPADPLADRERHAGRYGNARGFDVANLLLTAVMALAVACAYVLGTFPSADLAAHLALGRKADIRAMGSGNPGAANVMTQLGKKWGLFVLVLDVAKGAAACAAGRWMAGGAGASAAGSAAVIGHCFPLWNGFRGGKGVATGAGQVLMTFPAYFPINLAITLLTQTRGWRPASVRGDRRRVCSVDPRRISVVGRRPTKPVGPAAHRRVATRRTGLQRGDRLPLRDRAQHAGRHDFSRLRHLPLRLAAM